MYLLDVLFLVYRNGHRPKRGPLTRPFPLRAARPGSLSALGQFSPLALLSPHLTLPVDITPQRGVQEFSAMLVFLISKWKTVIQHETKITDTYIQKKVAKKSIAF